MAVETLASAPSLGRLYARAALSARGRGGELPDRTLRLESVRVDRDHLARYQRLCGTAISDVLPHTFPHLLGFPLQMELMARRDFPLPVPGLVHLENEITVHRRLTAEDRLTISVTARGKRPHRKGILVDVVTEVDVDGERVWDGRSSYLRRQEPNPGAPAPSTPPGMPDGPAAAQWRLPAGLGRQYASVSGDVNPIHLNPLTAKAMGFPRAIAHGMLTYAKAISTFGPDYSGPSTSQVWFRKPVLLPSTVDLVIDRRGAAMVAGLYSARSHGIEHMLLTLSLG